MKIKLLICMIVFCGVYLSSFYVGIRFNKSESLPGMVFLELPLASVQKGMIVLFDNALFDKPLAKKVMGTKGDKISFYDNKIYINGVYKGALQPSDSKGKKLEHIDSCIVPDGYVFVLGDHDKSFDSRYKDVGLVPIAFLKGRLICLW